MPQPTAPELIILKALWQQQPLSAKAIHDKSVDDLQWSYSSTRKTLDRMVDKGFLRLEMLGNKKSYLTCVEKINVLASFVQDIAERVFELDEPLPVAMFSDSRLIDDSEIDDLEKLLDDLSKKDK